MLSRLNESQQNSNAKKSILGWMYNEGQCMHGIDAAWTRLRRLNATQYVQENVRAAWYGLRETEICIKPSKIVAYGTHLAT